MNDHDASIDLKLLSSRQIKQLHEAALHILKRVGVLVNHERGIKLLAEAGASCDGQRVYFPASLVNQALVAVPKKIGIYDRKGRPVMELGGRNNYFGTGSDCISVIDPKTRKHRGSTKADVARIAALCDALPHIDFCMSMGVATDISHTTSYVHQFDAMIRNTAKPLVFTADNAEDMRDIFDLASVMMGSADEARERPRYILYNEPISPLQHTPNGLDKMIFAAEHNIPMIYIASPMLGASAPVTLAGCIAQANAEALSGLVIHQLIKPGAPFIYGADATAFDMKEMIFSYGCPELQIMNIAFADLAHYYNLPLFCIAGATDAKTVDAQAGAEMALSLLISAWNGCNLIHDVGYLESGLCSSLESIVLADELIGMVKRYAAGFDMNEETLALDVIARIGPRGDFLSDEHTLANFRQEIWRPRRFNRQVFEAWEQAGAEPITEPMFKEARELLAQHRPPGLSSQKIDAMKRILERRN